MFSDGSTLNPDMFHNMLTQGCESKKNIFIILESCGSTSYVKNSFHSTILENDYHRLGILSSTNGSEPTYKTKPLLENDQRITMLGGSLLRAILCLLDNKDIITINHLKQKIDESPLGGFFPFWSCRSEFFDVFLHIFNLQFSTSIFDPIPLDRTF
jgi:hypothetical protein